VVTARLLSLASGDGEQHVSDPVERMLAAARAVLAVVSLVAIYLDPTEPTRFVPLAYSLLVGYSLFSLALLGLVWRRPALGARSADILHACDVVMAAWLTIISEGPSSPFFPLFVFVLLAAAYRRDFRATLVTGAWITGLLLSETLLVSRLWPTAAEPLEVNRILIRCTYLMLVALLVGYVAQQEKEMRAEALVVARLSAWAHIARGLSTAMQRVLDELVELTGLTNASVFFEESTTGCSYVWHSEDRRPSPPTPFHWREVSADEARSYNFELPDGVGILQTVEAADHPIAGAVLDASSRRLPFRPADMPALPGGGSSRQAICIPVSLPGDSPVRLFLSGDACPVLRPRDLAIVQRIVRQVFPALYNLYLLRRLRTRIGEVERARVARELHDGVIQSLLGLEMQLEVLRRRNGAPPEVARDLASIQSMLHSEALNVRDLIHQMRPLGADARNVLQVIVDIVERFRRESGLHVQFAPQVQELTLTPRACQELARIVQEALVNIRRHSGASNVVIRLARSAGSFVLSVDDDGRGFDFEGRMSHDALDASRKGPIVIKERVRTIGGALAIESTPGIGSRLEVTVPVRIHA
jgi:signal transduction histidine kinase